MNIEIYTKPSCSRCVNLKKTLQKENVEYKEYVIGENISREQVLEKYPDAKMLPIVVYESVKLADSDQLVKIIMEKKNESSS